MGIEHHFTTAEGIPVGDHSSWRLYVRRPSKRSADRVLRVEDTGARIVLTLENGAQVELFLEDPVRWHFVEHR